MLQIDYIEFPSTDLAETQAFYEAAFGWTFQSWGPGYSAFEDGRLAGGFHLSETQGHGTTLVILRAEDLQAAFDGVVAAGGSIVKPIFAFPGGHRFEFTDPSGNALAVWSDADAEPASPEN
jgi:predicted enzyme related to lactoylglutathione lyase